MILIIEIGNSNIVIALYENQTKITQFRIRTIIGKTSDEYLIDLDSLLDAKNIERSLIRDSVMASVVAPLIPVFQKAILDLLGSQCRVVDWMSIPTMPIEVEEPNELGIDRLINAFAAFDLFRKALIVIDMGTATTFDVVSKDGKYLGGVISPGLLLSLNALISNTNKLPKIELILPESVIGKNTIHAMQSGAIYGYAGMVDAMVVRIKNELGYEAKVIATGGLSNVVKSISSEIEKVIDDLTVEGLLKISQL